MRIRDKKKYLAAMELGLKVVGSRITNKTTTLILDGKRIKEIKETKMYNNCPVHALFIVAVSKVSFIDVSEKGCKGNEIRKENN